MKRHAFLGVALLASQASHAQIDFLWTVYQANDRNFRSQESPDGTELLLDKGLVFDRQTLVFKRKLPAGIENVYSPAGDRVYTLLWSGRTSIHELDSATGESLRSVELPYNSLMANMGLCLSQDGRLLAAAYEDDEHRFHVAVVDTGPFQIVATVIPPQPSKRSLALEFSPERRYLATASQNGLFLYATSDWSLKRVLSAGAGPWDGYPDVCFSPDGTRVAFSTTDGPTATWNVETGARELLFAEDGGSVAYLSDDVLVRITAWGVVRWTDTHTGQVLKTQGARYWCTVRTSRDRSRLIFSGRETNNPRDLFEWDAATGSPVGKTPTPTQNLWDVAWFPALKEVWVSDAQCLTAWSEEDGRLLRRREGLLAGFRLCMTEDRSAFLAPKMQSPMRIFDSKSWDEIASVNLVNGIPEDADLSPDGTKVAAFCLYGTQRTFRLYDVATGALLHSQPALSDITLARWSGGSRYVVLANGRSLTVFDAQTLTSQTLLTTGGKIVDLATLPNHTDFAVMSVHSKNGSASACHYRLGNLTPVRSFRGHTQFSKVELTPDGRHLVALDQSRIRYYRLFDGAAVAETGANEDRIRHSPDSSRFAVLRRGLFGTANSLVQ